MVNGDCVIDTCLTICHSDVVNPGVVGMVNGYVGDAMFYAPNVLAKVPPRDLLSATAFTA